MRRAIIAYLFFCIGFLSLIKAQISHGGEPLPWDIVADMSTKSRADSLFVTMPDFDLREQLRQDSLDARILGKNVRFAYKFKVQYTPENAGIRFTLPDGTKVWRFGIRSRHAYSISLFFPRFHLPEGACLFLYNPDRSEVAGAFNALNNTSAGVLPVAPVQGDELIVEYQEPQHAAFPGELEIGEVNHGYRDFRAARLSGDSERYTCMPPVVCFQDTTDRYDLISRSVVLMIVNGVVLCNGILINNTACDKRPFLLTASHCLNGQFTDLNPDYETVANSIICYFNYESPQCHPIEPGPADHTMASAHCRAVNEDTDLALLELMEIPPSHYAPYYAGWNAVNAGQPPYVGIHHPGGSLKRLIRSDLPVRLETYEISIHQFREKSHWKVDAWQIGATSIGSSGSPLFDFSGRLIGALTGGASSCSNPKDDFYYSLSESWDVSPEPARQLKFWLDPAGVAIPICNGLDPYLWSTGSEQSPELQPIRIIPDPAGKRLYIRFPSPPLRAELRLFTPDGRLLECFPVIGMEPNIALQNLSPGLYVAQILYDGKVFSRKIRF